MSVPSAPTISVNAQTAEPLFFSRNMGHMIHIAFETIILSIMSYYFYKKTSTLSNEMKVMEAKISQLELTVKEQKTFINEKISEMVSLVSSQISRSSFQAAPPPRQVYQNFQQPVQQYQPQPVQQTQYQPQPVQSQTVQPVQQVQSQTVQQQPVQPVQLVQSQQTAQQQTRYPDNMTDVSIVVMEMINPAPKNEKYSQISVIEDDDDTIDMDKELKEELSELASP
jgi:cell division protein FtsN